MVGDDKAAPKAEASAVEEARTPVRPEVSSNVAPDALPAEEISSGKAGTGAAEPIEAEIPVPASLLAKESVDSALRVGGWDDAASVPTAERAELQTRVFPRSGIAWGALFVAGLVLALLQMVYLFRSDIAQASPALRPTLVSWCARLDCVIELPRRADLINIDVSDLQPDADRQGHLVLTAGLKNKATFAQAFPFLELTLTNSRNQALARRVIAPEAYLPPELDLKAGFPPHADVSLRLVIDATGVGAMGYQLYLFYP